MNCKWFWVSASEIIKSIVIFLQICVSWNFISAFRVKLAIIIITLTLTAYYQITIAVRTINMIRFLIIWINLTLFLFFWMTSSNYLIIVIVNETITITYLNFLSIIIIYRLINCSFLILIYKSSIIGMLMILLIFIFLLILIILKFLWTISSKYFLLIRFYYSNSVGVILSIVPKAFMCYSSMYTFIINFYNFI